MINQDNSELADNIAAFSTEGRGFDSSHHLSTREPSVSCDSLLKSDVFFGLTNEISRKK